MKCLSVGFGRLTDISRKLDLNKSTTHRILKTLENTGFATQDPLTHRYYLGPLIQSLASNPMMVHQNLIESSLDPLEHLRGISGETVGIQIRLGSQRIILEELQSPQHLKFFRGKGESASVFAGASGKVLLAEIEEDALKKLLARAELVPVGPATITDKDRLLKEIKKVRKQGYATGLRETFEGAVAIAAPISHYECPVALGVVGPENRFRPKMMDLLGELKACAKNISNKLIKIG